MVSILGMLDGLTSIGIVVFSILIGLLSLYEAKKYNVRLLRSAALTMIFVGFFWLAPTADFLSLLITGKNLTPIYIYGILSYMWVAPGTICAMYFGAELNFPKQKWYIVGFYVIIGLIFEFFLWFDTANVFNFTLNNPGQEIIDSSFKRTHINYYLVVLMLVSIAAFIVVPFTVKAVTSLGIIRKKFMFLAIGYAIFVITGIFESLFSPGVVLFSVRLTMMSFPLWMYLGVREEPEKKVVAKKEVKIEGGLFRISRTRPEELTEEEISISKEKKICLVCKGKVSRTVYVCPECDAFYCDNCSKALVNLENACWACNFPIDESKPVKPYKKDDKEGLKILEKKSDKIKGK